MPTPSRRRAGLVAALGCALAAGCAAPPLGTSLADTRRDLTRALTARGWTVEPTEHVDVFGVEATGTAYALRQRGDDRRRVLMFEAPATDDGPDRDALDRDHVVLRQRLAGRSAVFYRRPALLVVTFGTGRTALDLRLAQLLGPPVPAVDG